MPPLDRPRRRIPPKPGSRPVKAATAPANGIVVPTADRALPLLRTSERGQFKRCTWRWWQGSVEGWGPVDEDIKLWFGTGWHLVMAHHYGPLGTKRGKDPHKVWKDYVNDKLVKIRVNAKGESYEHEQYMDAETLGHQMIDGYLEKYQGDPSWHIIQAERIGFVLIPSRQDKNRALVQYAVTYDAVYRDLNTDKIWLAEHKTAASISTNHLDLDPQAGSYFAIATHDLRASGKIGKRETLKGIMYNFAKKSPPDDRELGPDGLTHNKPNKENYLAVFREYGVDPEEYASGRGIANLKKLAEIANDYGLEVLGDVSAKQPTDNFKRHPVFRTRHEVTSQIQAIQNDYEVMDEYKKGNLPITKNQTKDCSWDCSFYQMCLLHERGSDWEEFREALYVKGDPYEPYNEFIRDGGE
jgi:hypothetical protein